MRFAWFSASLLALLAACGGIAVLGNGGSGGTGGSGGYDACAGKACGEFCSPCDPNDPDCAAPAVEYYCSSTGQCTSSPVACPVAECSDSLPCPPIDGVCITCSDGSASCPHLECVQGSCVTDYEPNCPCEPQDATGVGGCEKIIGYAWGKLGCEVIGGCSCEGVDCDELFPDLESCEAQVCNVK